LANLLPKIEEAVFLYNGTLQTQFNRCGKRPCRCYSGDLHGPYFYIFYREFGLLKKVYVRRADVAEVRAACETQGQLRQANRELHRDDPPELSLCESIIKTTETIRRFLGSIRS